MKQDSTLAASGPTSIDLKTRSQDLETFYRMVHQSLHGSGKFLDQALTAMDDERASLVVLLFGAPEVLEGAE